jgi:BolA protein
MNLEEIIYQRMQTAFSPTRCEVIDDSKRHEGHAGARDGGKHFILKIAAPCFLHRSRVAVHREIYQALEDLIPHKIHALQILLLKAVDI